MGGAGVKRVDYTDGISTESPVCDGALQLHQVISPCERCCWLSCIPTTPGTPSTRWPEGKDAREHSSTLSVFIPQSSKRRLPLHASYCCMRFTCFPFSTANVNKSLSCTRKRRLPLHGASNNMQVSRIPLTFEQETPAITWCKQQHASLNNSLIFEQDT